MEIGVTWRKHLPPGPKLHGPVDLLPHLLWAGGLRYAEYLNTSQLTFPKRERESDVEAEWTESCVGKGRVVKF
jgi:hypothetical protein